MKQKTKIILKWIFVVVLFISMVFNCVLATKITTYDKKARDAKTELKAQVDLNAELIEEVITIKEEEQYLLSEIDTRDAKIEQLNKEITTLKKK